MPAKIWVVKKFAKTTQKKTIGTSLTDTAQPNLSLNCLFPGEGGAAPPSRAVESERKTFDSDSSIFGTSDSDSSLDNYGLHIS